MAGSDDDIPEVKAPETPLVRNINSTGFSSNLSGSGSNMALNFTRSPEASTAFSSLLSSGQAASKGFTDLMPLVSPGISKLRQSTQERINLARDKAIGDLRDSLSRRRVAGSSFANDALVRAESEFARAQADADSQITLQELALSSELVGKRLNSELKSISSMLSQLNTESSLALGLSDQARQSATAGAQLAMDAAKMNAQIQIEADKAMGGFFSGLVDAGLSAFGGQGLLSAGGIFGPKPTTGKAD